MINAYNRFSSNSIFILFTSERNSHIESNRRGETGYRRDRTDITELYALDFFFLIIVN